MKTTPRPWTDGKTADSIIAPNGGGLDYHPEQYARILDWYGGELICESVALNNKPLIKAAPDLLAACRALAKPGGGLYVLPNYHYTCAYCGAPPHKGHPNDFEHFDDCPILAARTAIAAAEPESVAAE